MSQHKRYSQNSSEFFLRIVWIFPRDFIPFVNDQELTFLFSEDEVEKYAPHFKNFQSDLGFCFFLSNFFETGQISVFKYWNSFGFHKNLRMLYMLLQFFLFIVNFRIILSSLNKCLPRALNYFFCRAFSHGHRALLFYENIKDWCYPFLGSDGWKTSG